MRRLRPWCIALAALLFAGCQTPLPLDRTDASATASVAAATAHSPAPAERRSRWLEAVEERGNGSERTDPFQLEITPDRLREVARYDPAVSTPGRARSFILVVDTCTAHHTYHHRLR